MRKLKYRLAVAAEKCASLLARRQIATGTRVLMFHGVGDNVDADHDLYNHSPDHFFVQISAIADWVRRTGTSFVRFESEQSGGVCLTFDDGYSSLHHTVAPYLIDRKIPFHIFVPPACSHELETLHLSHNQLRSLATESLIGIGAHGYRHRDLTEFDDSDLADELARSRSELSRITGTQISTMSYPFGQHDERVRKAVRQAGFTLAATSAPGSFTTTTDLLQVPRIDIWALDSPQTVINKIVGGWDWLL
jgi:peptidoglycan/xylan/chitin deacetylase (PgdA/CDA1 family)